MTTIGVKPASGQQRVLPMNIPTYSYQYPSMQRVQLAAVKEGIYHPSLPTFRRMDMDTAGHKLPAEHCRTTTTVGPADFRRSSSSMFEQPQQPLHSKNCTATGRELHKYYTTPEELRKTRADFSKFLDRCPERYQIRLPALEESKDVFFEGYNARYLRPEITSSWKYTLTQEPNLDQYGQRPIPANIYARYRDSHPKYSRSISNAAWRP